MNHQDQEQLLRELLAGEDVAHFRQASLERTLVSLRRRKHRRALGASVLAALPLLGILTVLFLQLHGAPYGGLGSSNAPVVLLSQPAGAREIEVINDEQLFALFPDRPMALIGKPGEQKLVFLGKTARP